MVTPPILPAGFATLDGKVISGIRDQLCTPRMSGPLVPAIGFVHVPVPWRSLLPDGARASGPPERGLFEYHYKIDGGKLFIKAGEMPTPGAQGPLSNIVTQEYSHAPDFNIGDWLDAALADCLDHP